MRFWVIFMAAVLTLIVGGWVWINVAMIAILPPVFF